MLAQRAYQRA
ncbi:hypothetical protein A2U01_0105073, partial [Trifolium medium]|nr:hypothetical protein [Trifolium medium]